jgi:hypothetical protein
MSKIVIVSGFTTAKELVTEALIRYIHQDDTIVNVDGNAKTALDAAIAALAADKDVIYVLGNISDSGIITETQETALEAKLAEEEELVNYTSTDQITGIDMAYQAWADLFGTGTTPSPAIIYTSDLLSKLTATEELQGTYLKLSIPARYYDNLDTDESLYELWALLDEGLVPSSEFRAAHTAKSPWVNYRRSVLTNLLLEGEAIANYIDLLEDVTTPIFNSFSIEVGYDTCDGVINHAAQTIAVEVPAKTTVTALVATFDVTDSAYVHVGATAQVSGETENNFTSPVVYALCIGGNVKLYTVTVGLEA